MMEDIKGSTTGPIKGDYSKIQLKKDCDKRPLWICEDHHLFLEPTTPSLFEGAAEFLTAIAEPRSRPHYIYEYEVTKFSLYAATSIGYKRDKILSMLDTLCKNSDIPARVKAFIEECTAQYGRAKLVLISNKYMIETSNKEALDELLTIPIIAREYQKHELKEKQNPIPLNLQTPQQPKIQISVQNNSHANPFGYYTLIEEDEKEDEDIPLEKSKKVKQFEIQVDNVEEVKKICRDKGLPLIEEYEFKKVLSNTPTINIDLSPTTQIRPYQEKSLSQMLQGSRARSGIIVLPCGSGKTLVGISAICTIKRSAIVLCTSGVAVTQWVSQILKWTNAENKDINIVKFTSKQKDEMFDPRKGGVLVTTYTMVGYTGVHSTKAQEIIDKIMSTDWGILIADEVQVVPAEMFRKIMSICKAHCKLGLTATLVREDNKIDDLTYLIGPKLYEANWQNLQKQGYIAKVQCIEVWCPMTPDFFIEYLKSSGSKTVSLYVANPNKFIYCQYLIMQHEKKGDKIIVFSDSIFVLKEYSALLGKKAIYGETSEKERTKIFEEFEKEAGTATLFLSKVGDTSIDLPSANVIIQISSQFGSRRQEAQRLGRILRPKENPKEEYNAFFYTLISKNTSDIKNSHKRQQFLVEQGYAFKVLKELPVNDDKSFITTCKMYTKEEQKLHLDKILKISDSEFEELQPIDEDDITARKS